MTIRNLAPLFRPRSVAVIGGSSTPGSLGERVLANIIEGGFGDTVFAVNPKRVTLEGVWWAPTVDALPEVPDLAVIVTPAATVGAIIGELGALGTKVAVVISAGIEDAQAKAAMLEAARPHLLRIVGPNCLGVQMPYARLNASFAPRTAAPGRLAFISQSGALVTAMLDWAADRNIGFSSVISAGDMADVDLGDLIDMLAADARTDAILLYIEGVTNPAKFMSAARAAARIKPVIAIKAGRSAAAGKAALSHTGALAGAYDVHAAAFARAGIVLVDSLTELFDAAQVLCRYHPRTGERLAIITNGGGAGVLAADALGATGGRLATLAPATIAALDPHMATGWSRANPVDVIGDAHADRFAAATSASLADPGVDALLVIHCPTAAESGIEVAKAVIAALGDRGLTAKPVIACWMGPRNAAAVQPQFDAAGVPMFDNLDAAVRGFGYLLQAARGRRRLMRAPSRVTVAATDRARAQTIIDGARRDGRNVLSAIETKDLLAAYGVPIAPTRFSLTADAVAEACQEIAGPYAVKLVSPDLTHKSDVGGVVLDLVTAAEAMAAAQAMAQMVARDHPQASITGFEVATMVAASDSVELLLGIADDATFGPVIAFGAGGKAVEILNDRALGLPPLDDALAREMVAATRVSRLLGGYRDVAAVDSDAIVRAINALSAIAVDFPDLLELDVNPLVATKHGVVAIDARALISDAPGESRLVIRPVPVEWTADLVTRSELRLHVRPVLPDDEEALAEFFRNVAPDDLRFRFLTGRHEVGRDQLVPMTQIDYRRTMHFLAFVDDGTLVASAMLACDPDHVRAELAISVHAGFRNRGVGWTMVEHAVRYADAEGIEVIESVESSENYAALALEREAGFVAVPSPGGASEITLRRRSGAR